MQQSDIQYTASNTYIREDNTLLWPNESEARMKDMHGGKKGRLAIAVVASSCSIVVVVVSVLTVLTVLIVQGIETAVAV